MDGERSEPVYAAPILTQKARFARRRSHWPIRSDRSLLPTASAVHLCCIRPIRADRSLLPTASAANTRGWRAKRTRLCGPDSHARPDRSLLPTASEVNTRWWRPQHARSDISLLYTAHTQICSLKITHCCNLGPNCRNRRRTECNKTHCCNLCVCGISLADRSSWQDHRESPLPSGIPISSQDQSDRVQTHRDSLLPSGRASCRS